MSRRAWLEAGSIGLMGLGMNHVAGLRAADASPGASVARAAAGGRAKSVVFIFLSGGLTQHESFDPKPAAPANIRGDFLPIATKTPGLDVTEHLPLLAERSAKWSVVRTLTTPYNEHSQGHMTILSGVTEMPPAFNASKPQSTDWPSIASVVGDAMPRRNNLPPAIILPERLIHRSGRVIPGQFGGLMGTRRDPWFVEASPFNANSYGAYPEYEFHFERGREHNPNLKFQAPNLTLPQGLDRSRLDARMSLQGLIDRQRADLERAASVESFDRHRQSAISLLTERRVQKAFDVHNADTRLLDRYGRNSFGWSLLMARQLVEAGVSLVQVNLGNNETWDTHENMFSLLRECLLPPTDKAVSALLDDLDERGLLDETLIVMCGEMGRTPRVNGRHGRDHWGAVQSLFVAGGGIPGGIVVGVSDRDAAYPVSSPQRPENLAATIYHALGIPPTAAWSDEQGRPHHLYADEPIVFA